jgi:[acyl-carrier-protein] S-malonyltransferase
MSTVFLFPGQGSQKIGMAADFYKEFDIVKQKFDSADRILKRELTKICFEGPAETLTLTQNTQPALFTVEAAICDILKEKGIRPAITMGHSLGEYSALYAAGFFSFDDGLRIVAKRGELMAEAGKSAPGAMSAVIGLSVSDISKVLTEISGVVVAANENSPDQTVISGEIAAVKDAGVKLSAAGAKRVISLPVSGAFHSALMKPIADDFAGFLKTFTFLKPECSVVSNVTAKAENNPSAVKELLVKQMVSPVKWVDSMAVIKKSGFLSGIEIGPGLVLKGLGRKCDPEINIISCETVDNLYSVVSEKTTV